MAPSPTPTSPPAICSLPTEQGSATQVIAPIENYTASRFFPDRSVVVKDVALKLYMPRLHTEYINGFSIWPFLRNESFGYIEPGPIGEVEFTPDLSGEKFRIINEGHDFSGSFIVVDSVDEARSRIAEWDIQEFSMIHDLDGGCVYPSRIVVQKGIPVKVYNPSLKGDDRVSIEPFYTPVGVNVKGRKVTTFEFTSDAAGGVHNSIRQPRLRGNIGSRVEAPLV